MSEGKKQFDVKIEELANFLCDRALGNETVDKELVDCFKGLAGYYASSRKLDRVVSEEEDTRSGGGFGAIKRRIAEAGSDSATGSLGGDVPAKPKLVAGGE